MLRCRMCDDELTYPLDNNEFDYGLLCDQCQARHMKFDDYRVWHRHKKEREAYHAARRQEHSSSE